MLFYIGLLLVILFLGIILRADGDLILLWKEKFGQKIESLSGQVVWITGASSGIGESIAYILAQAGCKLVLSARRADELERVKAMCLKIGKAKLKESDVMVLPLDVVEFDTHAPAVQKVMDHFKQIDILINNAGKTQFARWVDVELDVDRKLFEINVLGPVSLTQCVLPHMIARRKGQVCVMSSLSGKLSVVGMRSYTTSKHAVHGSFECLRAEIVEHNIGVTMICPGPTFSNIYMHAVTHKADGGSFECLRAEVGEHNIGVTMICPGPTFSNLYTHAVTHKADGRLGRKMDPSEKRMSSERCAYLSCVAIANGMYETWVAEHPSLAFVYLSQYLPGVAKWILLKVGGKRAEAIRKGE